MRKLFGAFICLTLLSTAAVGCKDKASWEEIANNPKLVKYPTAAETQVQAVVPATTGYQTYLVADKFLFVFAPDGKPVVVFDLTMDHLTWKDYALGAVGIGDFSLRDIFKRYKMAKEDTNNLLEGDSELPEGVMPAEDKEDGLNYGEAYKNLADIEEKNLPAHYEADDIKRGYSEFAKLEFNDAWLKRNGHRGDQRKGFKPTSFTLGDLQLDEKDRDELFKLMEKVATTWFRVPLAKQDLDKFMSQFRYDWDQEKQSFNLTWSPQNATDERAKAPNIPDWVANYVNPVDILAYKYRLNQIDMYLGSADMIFGKYGALAGIFVSRVTNGIRYRFESHENQLMALVEAAQRGEYEFPIPLTKPEQFLEMTDLVLYLNKVVDTDDVTNAVAKRKMVLESEAKNRAEALKWFEKKGYDVEVWKDGRFATVSKKGKRKGIASLTIKKHLLTRAPTFHMYDRAKWYKTFKRIGLEAFTAGVRYVLPSYIDLSWLLSRLGNIGISIYIPGSVWDMIFRGRSYTEIAYEGHIIGQLNETIPNRLVSLPGYTVEEMKKMKNWLYVQRSNPFEVSASKEEKAIQYNLELVKKFLEGARGATPDFGMSTAVAQP